MNSKIGFIGVGNMGGPMCRNLLAKGNPVVACDLNPEALKAVAEAGAETVATPAALAEVCGIIFCCLPLPAHVESVLTGPEGVAQKAAPGTLVVDLSTNAPAMVNRLAQTLEQQQIAFMDAPVSGGVGGAREGTLAIMCGGTQQDFDRAKPLLDCMGANVVRVGDVGAGSVTKLCNNLTSFCNLVVAVESLMLAQRAGLNPRTLADVMQTASGASFALKRLQRKGLAGDWSPEFSLELAYKDLGLALELAGETETPLGFGPMVKAWMDKARALGRDKEDLMTLQRLLEEELETEIRA